MLIWKIAGAFTAKPDTETVESDPKQTETDQNSTTDTEDKNSEESTDDLVKTSSGLELKKYPDTGETVATILIDPGHGGYDPGNMSDPTDENSIKEKDINLAVAQKVIARLNEINPQIKIYYTRIDDTVSWASEEIGDLTGRVEMQKNSNADLFLSIHCNAYPDNSEISGYEYYIKPNDPVMSAITEAITRNLEQTGYSEYKGTLLTDQYVLQVITDAQIPAALMEIGYMTNPEELSDLTNPDVQQKLLIQLPERFPTTS